MATRSNLALLGIWILVAQAFSQGSVVRNGGFEDLDDTGKALHWANSRVEALEDGNHVMLVPFTWGFNQTCEVGPNVRYLLSMDVKRRRGPSAARLAVSVRDKDGNKLTSSDVRHAFVGDDWETARGLVATSADAVSAIVYVLTLDKDRNSAFLCDNVRMVPLGSAPGVTGRVWNLPDPLYEPLLGAEPPGLVREGAMVWSHMLYIDQLRDVAARMGREFSEEGTFAHLGEKRLHPIRVPAGPLYRKHGVTCAIYPGSTARGTGSILHPRSFEHYLDQVRKVLAEHRDQVWAIFAQDGAEEHAIRQIVNIGKTPTADADFLKSVDEEIRAMFGFGKYGLPGGTGAEESFRWIAFRRWVNARFRERHERLSKLVRDGWPGVRLISTDPMGRLSPFEFSLQTDLFDIFTQQFLPRSNPTRCPVGLYVKLIADLTGKEVWPCVHVENYAYPTTPDEVRELYSQVWRNGGSGFHLYIPDTANARKKKGDTRLTQWGSPRRYRAILEIIDRASKQNRLQSPADEGCRVFYCNYAHMAFANPSSIQDPMESCYTLLGPVARSWFTIVDEHRLVHPLSNTPPKVIYLPYARIMDRATRERLEGFVEGGGTLVVGDPAAFSYDIDGTTSVSARDRLVGARIGGGGAGRCHVGTDTVPSAAPGRGLPAEAAAAVHAVKDGACPRHRGARALRRRVTGHHAEAPRQRSSHLFRRFAVHCSHAGRNRLAGLLRRIAEGARLLDRARHLAVHVPAFRDCGRAGAGRRVPDQQPRRVARGAAASGEEPGHAGDVRPVACPGWHGRLRRGCGDRLQQRGLDGSGGLAGAREAKGRGLPAVRGTAGEVG